MSPDYEEALKKIYSKTPKDNFMSIKFNYCKYILLPYDEGLKFLASLKQAELLTEHYSKPKKISSFDSTTFETKILSRKEYEDIKIADLLRVTVEELYAKGEQPTTT